MREASTFQVSGETDQQEPNGGGPKIKTNVLEHGPLELSWQSSFGTASLVEAREMHGLPSPPPLFSPPPLMGDLAHVMQLSGRRSRAWMFAELMNILLGCDVVTRAPRPNRCHPRLLVEFSIGCQLQLQNCLRSGGLCHSAVQQGELSQRFSCWRQNARFRATQQ